MRGAVDRPRPRDVVHDVLAVSGWAHSPDQPVSRVDIQVGPVPVRGLVGRVRADVARHLEDDAALLAGFEAELDLTDLPVSGPTQVQVTVTLLDGSRHDLPTVPVRVRRRPPPDPVTRMHLLRRPRRRLAWRPRRTPVRLLLAARSLDQGGSQLRMAELVEGLRGSGRFTVSVVSPSEGPLRTRLEAAGATVHVRPDPPADNPAAYDAGVVELASWLRGRFDLVFGFTITSYAAVDAAVRLGTPALLRVGENEPLRTVARWVGRPLHPEVEARARQVIAEASAVVFNSRAGLERHRGFGLSGRFGVLHSGIDLGPDGATPSGREQARERLCVPPGARVLLGPGSFWPVKGQGVLLEAFRAAAADHPDALLVLIGLGSSSYRTAVARLAEHHGLAERVRIVDFAEDLTDWWRAADVMVCSSESEAAPGVVLEAAASRVPVVATDVGLVDEVVQDGRSGWLCEPGDVASLAGALAGALSAPAEQLRSLGAGARACVEREHDREQALRAMERLLVRAAQGRRHPL